MKKVNLVISFPEGGAAVAQVRRNKATAFAGMSDKEIQEYRKYFWAQDTSGDGKLNRAEFKKMMLSMGVKLDDKELRRAFNAADTDKSGSITFNEFAQTYLNKQVKKEATYTPEHLKEVFKRNDKDRDGTLTREECLSAMKMLNKNLSDRGMRRVMDLMDKDKDGGVSFTEFCYFMEK